MYISAQPEQETDRLQQLIRLLEGGNSSCMSTFTPFTPSSIYPGNHSLPAQLSCLLNWKQCFFFLFFSSLQWDQCTFLPLISRLRIFFFF